MKIKENGKEKGKKESGLLALTLSTLAMAMRFDFRYACEQTVALFQAIRCRKTKERGSAEERRSGGSEEIPT